MDDKYNLITSRLSEILGDNELKEKLASGEELNVYWGTACTGRIHIGYMVPLLKLADFLRAGLKVIVLIADLHAMLDNLKSSPELIQSRATYYEKMLKSILRNMKVPIDKLEFIRGSSYQLTPEYQMDLLKLSSITTLHDTKKAGAEVVKQVDNPMLGGMIYPLMQALDEEYLGVHIQFGGNDQRKIFIYAAEYLPKIGYKKRIHLMNPMLTAINVMPAKSDGETTIIKMSSSDTNSKIDFLDTNNEVKKKVNKAYCLEGDLAFNPLMELCQHVIFPLLKNLGIATFVINRAEKYGGKIEYSSYEDLQTDFVDKKLFPADLKLGIIECLNNFFEPIHKEFSDEQNINLLKKAYPK